MGPVAEDGSSRREMLAQTDTGADAVVLERDIR